MKKTIALAACLATFAMHCQETENVTPRIKKIVITTTRQQANGELLTTEEIIRAIMITPEQAQELKAMYITQPVKSLENSMPYNKVFTIDEIAYFIMTDDATSTNRNITITDEDAQEPVENN